MVCESCKRAAGTLQAHHCRHTPSAAPGSGNYGREGEIVNSIRLLNGIHQRRGAPIQGGRLGALKHVKSETIEFCGVKFRSYALSRFKLRLGKPSFKK